MFILITCKTQFPKIAAIQKLAESAQLLEIRQTLWELSPNERFYFQVPNQNNGYEIYKDYHLVNYMSNHWVYTKN